MSSATRAHGTSTTASDVRLKMCIQVNEDDFNTVHHELGHNFYQLAYRQQPFLFMNSANDGFHEAIGDTIALSVTPAYLKQIGAHRRRAAGDGTTRGCCCSQALDKIAFLPFGLLIDQWRWRVFSGEIKPADYNKAWWDLRTRYQGVDAPVARSEEDFDPGAKYHVPANYPYTRYFLARILQFQFHRALCEAAGQRGPLHRCSIYGSQAAGERLRRTLAMGASRPWPEALEALTGAAADGRHGDRGLLRAAEGVARRAEPWPPGRLGVTVLISSSLRGEAPGAAPQGSWARRSPGGSLPSISSETHPLKPAFCRMRAIRG